MGEEKKPYVKREFFKSTKWWLTFLTFNGIMLFLRASLFDSRTFTMFFDVCIVLVLIFMLVELVHDRSMGDTILDTFVLVVIIWLVIRIFMEIPTQYNFLLT